MSNIGRPFLIALISILIIIFTGTLGYQVIEGWNFLDSFYMVIITLSTIGYGETHPLSAIGRVLTIFIIIFGVGTEAYAIKGLVVLLIEGGLNRIILQKQMKSKIENLKGHYIICGYGKIGRVIVSELNHTGVSFIIIEKDHEVCDIIQEKGFLFVRGNSTEDEVLKKAGIERAKGLVASLPSDADNLYVVLSSRELNKNLTIISRCREEESEKKLYRAGADKVISPYYIGALRMALAITKPTISSYMDIIHENRELDLNMEEIPIPKYSALHHVPLKDSQIRDKLGVIIIAIKKLSGKMILNPGSEELIEEGDHLIALGDIEQMKALHLMAKAKNIEEIKRITMKLDLKDVCRYI